MLSPEISCRIYLCSNFGFRQLSSTIGVSPQHIAMVHTITNKIGLIHKLAKEQPSTDRAVTGCSFTVFLLP